MSNISIRKFTRKYSALLFKCFILNSIIFSYASTASADSFPVTDNDSLQRAIVNPLLSQIDFQNDIALLSSLPDFNTIPKDILLSGNAPGLTTLHGEQFSGFNVSGKNITAERLSFSNFKGENGSAFLQKGGGGTLNLIFQNSSFLQNSSSNNGGAVYLSNSVYNLDLQNVEFIGNSAAAGGGAIYVSASNRSAISFENVSFMQNKVSNGGGGAIMLNQKPYTLVWNKGLVDSNSAQDRGGAIQMNSARSTGSKINLSNMQFNSNSSQFAGGAISVWNSDFEITIDNVRFSHNAVEANHTGIVYGGALDLQDIKYLAMNGDYDNSGTNAVFQYNRVSRQNAGTSQMGGGAIFLKNIDPSWGQATTASIVNYDFLFNSALGNNAAGGAIFNTFKSNTPLLISKSNFEGNVATAKGGAIYNGASSALDLSGKNIFLNNFSDRGAISNDGILNVSGIFHIGNSEDGSPYDSQWKNGVGLVNMKTASIVGNKIISKNDAKDFLASDDWSVSFKNHWVVGSTRLDSLFGSAIHSNGNDSSLIVDSVLFSANTVSSSVIGALLSGGGTVFIGDSSLKSSISNSLFEKNSMENTVTSGISDVIGYVVAVKSSMILPAQLDIHNTSFLNNFAVASNNDYNGNRNINVGANGLISLSGLNAKLNVTNSWFQGNSTQNKGTNSKQELFSFLGGSIFSNNATGNGAASFKETTFEANELYSVGALIGGGVMSNVTGDLVLGKTTFTANKTQAAGQLNGGVIGNISTVVGFILDVVDSDFSDNTVTSLSDKIYGGVLANGVINSSTNSFGSATSIQNTSFINNKIDAQTGILGGIINNFKNTLTVEGGSFSGNKMTSKSGDILGGVIYQDALSEKVSMSNVRFSRNTASSDAGVAKGGVIYVDGNAGFDVGGFFDTNRADLGGVIYNNGSIQIADATTFIGNRATTNGGAIYNNAANFGDMNNIGFSQNRAAFGGAIYNNGFKLVLNNGQFSENAATSGGGAVFNAVGLDKLLLSGDFSSNTAGNSGGAVFNAGTNIENIIKNSTFNTNAAKFGGAIYNSGVLSVYDSSFDSNTADISGGAVHNTGTMYLVAQVANTEFKTTTDTIWSSGDVYLNMSGEKSIVLNGDVLGTNTANLFINTAVAQGYGQTGAVKLNSILSGFNLVRMDNGVLAVGELGSLGTQLNPVNLTMSAQSELNLWNGIKSDVWADNLDLKNTVNEYPAVSINLDFGGVVSKVGRSDTINVKTAQSGIVYFKAFKILNESLYAGETFFQIMDGNFENDKIRVVHGYVDTGHKSYKIAQNPENRGNNWIGLVDVKSPFADPLRDAIYLTKDDYLGIRPIAPLGENAQFAFAVDLGGNVENYYASDYENLDVIEHTNNVADFPITSPAGATENFLTLTITGYDGTRESILDAGIYTDKVNHLGLIGGVALLSNDSILDIENVTIKNAHFGYETTVIGGNVVTFNDGAAINNTGKLTTNNVLFENNISIKGGAIFNNNKDIFSVNLVATDFVSNKATDGGALYNAGQKVTISGSLFKDNTASTNGGAVFNALNGSMVVDSAQFKDNAAAGLGEAIYNAGTLSLKNTIFAFTTAGNKGSATIYNTGSLYLTALADNITMSGNTGGAIYSTGNVYLDASENYSVSFNDTVDGTQSGNLFITDKNKGSVIFNNNVSGFGSVNLNGGNTRLTGATVLSSDSLNMDAGSLWLLGNGAPLSVDNLEMSNSASLNLGNVVQTALSFKNGIIANSTINLMNGVIGDTLNIDNFNANNAQLNVDVDFANKNSDKMTFADAIGSIKYADFKLANETAYFAPTTFHIIENLRELSSSAIATKVTTTEGGKKYFIVDNSDGSVTFVLDSRPYTDPLLNAIFLTSTNLNVMNKGSATYAMQSDPFNPIIPTFDYTASEDISAHLISAGKANTLTINGSVYDSDGNKTGGRYFIGGDNKYALLNVDTTGTLALSSVILKDATASATTKVQNGAALHNLGTTNATFVEFNGNTASGLGQAIYNAGSLTLNTASFINNSGNSAALYNAAGGNLTINGSGAWTGNTGGAIYSDSANAISITATSGDIAFSGNTGGDIYAVGNVNLTANGGNLSFTNQVKTLADLALNATAGNIVFDGATHVGTTMSAVVNNGRSLTFNGELFGGDLDLTNTGTVNFNNTISGASSLKSTAGILNFSTNAEITSALDAFEIGDNATINVNGLTNGFTATNMSIGANSIFNLSNAASTNITNSSLLLGKNSNLNLKNNAQDVWNAGALTIDDTSNFSMDLNLGTTGYDISSDKIIATSATGKMNFSEFALKNYLNYQEPTSFTVMTGANPTTISGVLGMSLLGTDSKTHEYDISYINDAATDKVLVRLTRKADPYQNNWLKDIIFAANNNYTTGLFTGWSGIMDANYTSVDNVAALMSLSEKLSINTNTAGTAYNIDGNGYSLFDIATTGDLSVSNTNIINADGAIKNAGDLVLDNVKMAANTASNGGAVNNAAGATASIIGGHFMDNTASLGEAIFNAGSMDITDTVFAYTSAGAKGSATIYNSGTLNLKADNNMAFAGNSDGALNNAGTLNLIANADMIFNDKIVNTNVINQAGAVYLNSQLNGGIYNLNSGTLTLGDGGVTGTTRFNMSADTIFKMTKKVTTSLGTTTLASNALIDSQNGVTGDIVAMDSLNANSGRVFLDIDFKDSSADKINIVNNASGDILIEDINILNEDKYNSINDLPALVDKMTFNIMNGADLSALTINYITAGMSHTGYNTSYLTKIVKNKTSADLVLSAAKTDKANIIENAVLLANTYDKGWLLKVAGGDYTVNENTPILNGLLYVKGDGKSKLSANGLVLFDVASGARLDIDNTLLNDAILKSNGLAKITNTTLTDIALNGAFNVSDSSMEGVFSGTGALNLSKSIEMNADATTYVGTTKLNDASLHLGDKGIFFAGDFIVNGNSSLSLATKDLKTWNKQNLNISNWTLNNNLNTIINVDLVGGVADKFGGVLKGGVGKINLSGFKILSDKQGSSIIQVADVEAMNTLQLDPNYTLMGTLYKYILKYDIKDSKGGYLVFETTQNNPATTGGDIAKQSIGVLGALRTYNNAFDRMGKVNPRLSKENAEPYRHFWSEGDASWDKFDLIKGPQVKGDMQNMMVGVDGDTIELENHGFAYFSGYVGYLRSEQKYDGIKLNGDGGYLGVMGTHLLGNWINSVTLTTGYTNVETSSAKKKFDIYNSGIALKTAYNINVGDKVVITPSLQSGYTHVWSTGYKNYDRVKIKADDISAIQIIPAIKVSAVLADGYKPYLGIGYTLSSSFGGNGMADNARLPDYELDSYLEYKFGMEKVWQDNISAYAEGAIRSSGMTGGSINVGVKVDF